MRELQRRLRAWPRRVAGLPDWLFVAAGGAIVLVVLALTLALPYLQEKHRIATAVPQPYPLFAVALVELHPGQRACSDEVDLLPGRQDAEIRVGTFGKPPQPLLMTLTGAGYATSVGEPASYVDNSLIDFAFNGPARPLIGSVCVTNRGTRKIALYASADRTKSRSTTTVGGRVSDANFDLAFYSPRPRSLLERMGDILRQVKLFHANVAVWLLWVLLALFVAGVPLAALAAVSLAARRGTGAPPAPPPAGDPARTG